MGIILVVALSHIVGWVPSEAVALDNARGAAVAKPKPPALAEVQARKSSPKQPAVKPPSEPAWKAIERRCDAKDIHACFDLAHLYWDGKVTGWWEDTKAMEAFRRALAINKEQARVSQENACDAGKALGCDSLGLMYDIGEGVVQDWAKAVVLYQKACDAGLADGCNDFGRMYVKGKGVAQDGAKAAALYQKACDAGSANGCNNLGFMYERGESVAQDGAKAVGLYKKACEASLADGCNNIGRMYYNGTGVAQDKVTAAAFYQKACDAGGAWGCNNLGGMLEHGESMAPDQAKALQLYQKACDASLADGCNKLGLMYDNGTGVEQNKAKAVVLYQKACDAGNEWGCNNLGTMYDKGTGVAQDKAKAAALFQKACNDGIALGCNNLAAMHDKGTDVAQDQTKATPPKQKACDPGETSGCEAVARVPPAEKDDAKTAPRMPDNSEPVNMVVLFGILGLGGGGGERCSGGGANLDSGGGFRTWVGPWHSESGRNLVVSSSFAYLLRYCGSGDSSHEVPSFWNGDLLLTIPLWSSSVVAEDRAVASDTLLSQHTSSMGGVTFRHETHRVTYHAVDLPRQKTFGIVGGGSLITDFSHAHPALSLGVAGGARTLARSQSYLHYNEWWWIVRGTAYGSTKLGAEAELGFSGNYMAFFGGGTLFFQYVPELRGSVPGASTFWAGFRLLAGGAIE
jgi:hypothetical protein